MAPETANAVAAQTVETPSTVVLAEPIEAGTVFEVGLPLGFAIDDLAPAAQSTKDESEDQEQKKRKKTPLQAFLEGAWSTLKGETTEASTEAQKSDGKE